MKCDRIARDKTVKEDKDLGRKRNTLFFYKNIIFFEGFMFLFSRLNEAFNVLRAFLIQNTL